VLARLKRLLAALERLAGTRRGAPILVLVALGVYAFESIGWPLRAGRDLGVYLRYYAEIGQSPPLFPWAMLSRAPVTGVVAGGLLAAGGGWLAEAAMAGLYALSILAWSAAARIVGGPRTALVVAVALLVFPGYAGLFHELASDSVYAAVFAGWAYVVAKAIERRSLPWFAAAGAGVALLALTRPVSQALVLMTPLVLIVPGTWVQRLARAATFGVVAVLLLVAWAGYNEVRYSDFTVVRGGDASIPLFRVFLTDKIMSPDNGPASRRLAEAVRTHLLPEQPYRGYGITLNEFFASGTARMEEDLVGLSDRVFGWDTNYSVLGHAAREAVYRHPWTYTRGVATSFWQELHDPAYVVGQPPPPPPPTPGGPPGPGVTSETVVVDGHKLPKPSEGQPIPAAHLGDYESTPDGHIHELWRSPIDHGTVFPTRRETAQYVQLNSRMGQLLGRLPSRRQNQWLWLQQNRASKVYPPAWVWLLVGVVALVWRRPTGWLAPLFLAVAAVLVLLVTVLGVYSVPEYAVPVIPSFVLLAAVGLVGRRAPVTAAAAAKVASWSRRSSASTDAATLSTYDGSSSPHSH
jgi:hypothetical protein